MKHSLVSALVHTVLFSKKGYVELLQSLAGKVQSRCCECETTTWQLAERNAIMEELELKVSLLAEEAGQLGKMQRRLEAKVGESNSTKRAL